MAAPNEAIAKMMTTARMVTPGQTMATMPTANASRPRHTNEVDEERNTGILLLSAGGGATDIGGPTHCGPHLSRFESRRHVIPARGRPCRTKKRVRATRT